MTNGNDAAFSRAGFVLNQDDYDLGTEGMTKREYFAAMAMQGLLADGSVGGKSITDHHSFFTELATAYADALIEALNTESDPLPTQTVYFNGKPFETSLSSMPGEEIIEQARSKGLLEQWQLTRTNTILVEELPNGTNRIIGRGDEIGLGFIRKFSLIDGGDHA